jgi:tetratricopeptide (TPR) repeat protein
MAEKKKTLTAPKNSGSRTTKPQASKTVKAPEPIRMSAPRVILSPAQDGPKQLANFEAAMKLFHARKLKEARDMFQLSMVGPERDVANRSRMHAAMCDRRLQQVTPNLRSAEDYYNYGIALINSRNVVEACTHLEKALEIAPASDHIHYALALAQALGGDFVQAHDNLKRAIELEPRNRLIARQDADFAPLANQPPFDALIFPEKKGW